MNTNEIYVHPKYYANTDVLNELLDRYNKITSLVRDAIHEVNFDKLLEYILRINDNELIF